MPSFNQVTLIGNLTREVEIRVLPKGTSIGQFGLAVNREFKGESGEKREEVTFIDCEAWGKTAEIIAKYTTKGRSLLVSGRLKQDTWEDKQSGQKRSKIKVVVENFQFLGGKNDAPAGEHQVDAPAESAAPRPRSPAPRHDINDEDVPF